MAKKHFENLENEKTKNCKCNHEEHTCNCKNEECECGNNNEHVCKCNEKQHNDETCREDEFKDTLQRLQAEFENYRRRTESLTEKYKEDGIVTAINKLLPVLDSFKSAKAMIKDEEFLNSINLIEKQFTDGLSNLNVTKIDAENCEFNPNLHNAVLTGSEQDKEDNAILKQALTRLVEAFNDHISDKSPVRDLIK